MEYLSRPDGTNIHYLSLGEGETTLVLLHGWTANAQVWLPIASELAKNHHVIIWDARGHGGHEYADDCKISLPIMADDLEAMLEHLGITNAVLVGHSMGALTSWEYLRRHGDKRLRGLCVIDQSPKLVTDSAWQHGVYSDFSQDTNTAFLHLLSENFAEAVLEFIAFGKNRLSREGYEQNTHYFQQLRLYLQQQPGALLTQCWDSIAQQDYRDVVSNIQLPTLLVYGDESQFYSAELQQWISQAIKGSDLRIYANSDHSPHLWNKERFIDDLNCFIDSL
ncbi:MAG: alpha/beta hydrolase [Neptuniibacter caesariensis]|uniref:Alpha/beta hydrolase n=1 Tax=Neptuniibacter caesariensis TaxID=207954 RepID=A0A2G6JQ88_NEPCE|nr:MAG: alpha/beta hydrolase [Neptuniibacter caesariensis]